MRRLPVSRRGRPARAAFPADSGREPPPGRHHGPVLLGGRRQRGRRRRQFLPRHGGRLGGTLTGLSGCAADDHDRAPRRVTPHQAPRNPWTGSARGHHVQDGHDQHEGVISCLARTSTGSPGRTSASILTSDRRWQARRLRLAAGRDTALGDDCRVRPATRGAARPGACRFGQGGRHQGVDPVPDPCLPRPNTASSAGRRRHGPTSRLRMSSSDSRRTRRRAMPSRTATTGGRPTRL